MLTVTVAKYFATGLVLNPIDFADIELLKGGDGHYLWVQVPDGAEMRLWRVPVVESLALNAGEFLTGAFGLGARVWDREDTTVRITDSHADYFIRNKLVMLVEERVALTIERPESFVYGVFNNAPA
jgi:HK97 family phage major capsid protein